MYSERKKWYTIISFNCSIWIQALIMTAFQKFPVVYKSLEQAINTLKTSEVV